MASVSAEDERYKTAQDRVLTYRKNKELALVKAQQQASNNQSTSEPLSVAPAPGALPSSNP
jgi:hypothetical protein